MRAAGGGGGEGEGALAQRTACIVPVWRYGSRPPLATGGGGGEGAT